MNTRHPGSSDPGCCAVWHHADALPPVATTAYPVTVATRMVPPSRAHPVTAAHHTAAMTAAMMAVAMMTAPDLFHRRHPRTFKAAHHVNCGCSRCGGSRCRCYWCSQHAEHHCGRHHRKLLQAFELRHIDTILLFDDKIPALICLVLQSSD